MYKKVEFYSCLWHCPSLVSEFASVNSLRKFKSWQFLLVSMHFFLQRKVMFSETCVSHSLHKREGGEELYPSVQLGICMRLVSPLYLFETQIRPWYLLCMPGFSLTKTLILLFKFQCSTLSSGAPHSHYFYDFDYVYMWGGHFISLESLWTVTPPPLY